MGPYGRSGGMSLSLSPTWFANRAGCSRSVHQPETPRDRAERTRKATMPSPTPAMSATAAAMTRLRSEMAAPGSSRSPTGVCAPIADDTFHVPICRCRNGAERTRTHRSCGRRPVDRDPQPQRKLDERADVAVAVGDRRGEGVDPGTSPRFGIHHVPPIGRRPAEHSRRDPGIAIPHEVADSAKDIAAVVRRQPLAQWRLERQVKATGRLGMAKNGLLPPLRSTSASTRSRCPVPSATA